MSAVPTYLLLQTLGKEGQVNVAWDKRSKRYRVRFRFEGRQFDRSTGETDLKLATQRAAEIYAEVIRGPKEAAPIAALREDIASLKELVLQLAANGTKPQKPAIRKTLAEAFEEFMHAKEFRRKVAPSTLDRLKRRIESFARSVAGETPLSEITAEHIAAWVDTRPSNKPRSIKNDVDDIAHFFRWCGSPPRRWCDPELGKGVDCPQVSKQSALIEILTIDQARNLMAFIEKEAPQYALYYAIALFAGGRANKKESTHDTDSGEIIRLFEVVKAAGKWETKIYNGL